MEKACEIRNQVLDIAAIEERAFLRTLGMDISSDSESEVDLEASSSCEWTSEDSQTDLDENHETDKEHTDPKQFSSYDLSICSNAEKLAEHNVAEIDLNANSTTENMTLQGFSPPGHDRLALMLGRNKLDWFASVNELTSIMKQCCTDSIDRVLSEFTQNIGHIDFNEGERRKVEQSRQAYLQQTELTSPVNQDLDVVTDSESDDPEEWLSVTQLNSVEGLKMIKKQRRILQCRTKRKVAKEIAENRLLKRKLPKRVSAIVKEFPNIGADIEAYVRSKRCGADAWRRTGVTTFDGNRRRGPKVSYRRIQKHLQEKYNTSKISYGTVVQLCTVRNKRKLSAKRYKRIAKVMCRRSRKGFNVKYNPDAHWNCAFYKELDVLQLSDGRNKVLINRDDQAEFRLDTTYTHKGRGVSCEGAETTTRVDYVNKYSSILQTTSYHIMESNTTPQACIGVVKDQVNFQKKSSTTCCRPKNVGKQ